jgi:beta-N-acetylhexosaminidase
MVHFKGDAANADAEKLITEIGVGGIIYYSWANGLYSQEHVKQLSSDLQQLASTRKVKIPLLIGVDQEGGRVIHLKEGFTSLHSNGVVASYGDPCLAKTQARIAGDELRHVGININFAPVVDIYDDQGLGIIGDRSYGSSAEIVIKFAMQSIEGFHDSGIMTTLKHYPGHGSVSVDSHLGLPILSKSLEQLREKELRPFAELSNVADLIMTGHILVPDIDPDNCATLSKKLLTLLRDELGFKGVIISDSLVMQGVLQCCGTVDEAAIRALAAGCDILLLGGKQFNGGSEFELTADDIARIKKSIIQAVIEGRIDEIRIDQALKRAKYLRSPVATIPIKL